MLDPQAIDLGLLAEALEDHSPEGWWWIDPRTGEIGRRSEFDAERFVAL